MKKIIMQITIFLLTTCLLFTGMNLTVYGYSEENNDWKISLEMSKLPMNSITKDKNDVIVAVGGNGAIKTSKDGELWSIAETSAQSHLYKVRNINDKFWVVGDNGTLLTSEDGDNWEEIYTGVDNHLKDITFYNGMYYVVGESGTILYSLDGYNWTKKNTELRGDILEIEIFRNSIFFITKSKFYKTNDMENFAVLKDSEENEYFSIETNNNELVIAYEGKDTRIDENGHHISRWYAYLETTKDTEVWSKTKLDDSFNSNLVWDGNKFSIYSYRNVYSSVGGGKWDSNKVTSNFNKADDLISYKGKIIAVTNSNGNNNIAESEDGLYFKEISQFMNAKRYNDATWGNGNFIVVGNGGSIIQSYNGEKWSYENKRFGEVLAVDYGAAGYVASGLSGNIYFSKNGDSWNKVHNIPSFSHYNTLLNDIKWVDDRYICASENGEVLSSSDGVNWEQIYTIATPNNTSFEIQSIVRANEDTLIYNYNKEKTIVVKTNDYKVWTSYEYAGLIKGVTYVNGKYYAIGEKSIMTSSDGVIWEDVIKFNYSLDRPDKIIWTGKEFFISNSSVIIKSSDGVNWYTERLMNGPIGAGGIAYSGDKYLSVGTGRTPYGDSNVISTKIITTDSVPSRLEIIGNQYYEESSIDRKIQFKSKLVDQYNNIMSDYKVNWKAEENNLGIKIDSVTGELFIPKNCKEGKVLITASIDKSDRVLVGKYIYINKDNLFTLKNKEIKMRVGDFAKTNEIIEKNVGGLGNLVMSSNNSRVVSISSRDTIEAKSTGESIITFTNAINKYDFEIKVIVPEKEDINEDGVIDILDLSLLAMKYNKKIEDFPTEDKVNFKKYDLNDDDIIDIFDLVLIGKRM